MKRITKILAVTLLIICFASTLIACTGDDKVITDNKETTSTTATENKTTEATEPATTTEEPTTEEPTTEVDVEKYDYKGNKWTTGKEYIELYDGLVVEKGFKYYVNEYVTNFNEEYDVERGSHVVYFIALTHMSSEEQLYESISNKYGRAGDLNSYIPYADNYCVEYTDDAKYIFEFVGYDILDRAVFDVHEVD